MQNNVTLKLICICLHFFIFGCGSNIHFSPQNIDASTDPMPTAFNDAITETLLPIEQTKSIEQNYLDQNQTAISFQITKPDGQLLESLNPNDINLFENNVLISKFNITKNSENFRQIVDIVFAVDVTASMSSTIESAKLRLINFVNQSRKAGYRTRMCLITFGDYTVKNCNKFYDNNPDDAETQLQVAQLIAEITQLKALKGSQDPGGKDKNENPMRALIDASKAPWATNNQRFLILITDDGFLYSPGNSGKVGNLAPKYTEVKAALETSQMKVFAATPDLAGYNKKFGQDESIVNLSQGEWFNFNDLISGKISLDTILNRIITNVNTTFIAEYVADENEGLNPTLPVNQRVPRIDLKDNNLGTLSPLQIKSNLPDGREKYQDEFIISDKTIRKDSLRIIIDGVEISSQFSFINNKIKFFIPPKAGAKIIFKYVHEKLIDSFQLKPIQIDKRIKTEDVHIELNGYHLDKQYYSIILSDENLKYLILNPTILNENDLFDIRKNNALQIKVNFSYIQ